MFMNHDNYWQKCINTSLSPLSRFFLFFLLSSSSQTPLPVKWQQYRISTPTRPLEMWRAAMPWTSSWASEWPGPSPPSTTTQRAMTSRWSRVTWPFLSPSSPFSPLSAWRCSCTAAGPTSAASWGVRGLLKGWPPCYSSASGSSTSCSPLWRLTATSRASKHTYKRSHMHIHAEPHTFTQWHTHNIHSVENPQRLKGKN